MNSALVDSGLGITLVSIAFIGLLVFAFFRLDEWFAMPKPADMKARRATGTDEDGIQILSDPDGRRWRERVTTKSR